MIEVSDWQSLVLWRATCRAFYAVVGLQLQRKYNSYIRPFVRDISAFNDILDRHRAIISGATALHFLLPDSTWEPRELDIYVGANAYKPLVRTLVDTTGLNWTRIPIRKRMRARPLLPPLSAQMLDDSLDEYHSDQNVMCDELPLPRRQRVPRDDSMYDEAVLPETGNDNEFDDTFPDKNQDDFAESYIQMEHDTNHRPLMVHGTGFRTMRSFRTRTGRRVNVVCSHTNMSITPLRSFWSTLTMNFLTTRGGTCGFPSATLERVGALKRLPLSSKETASRDAYVARGFTFASSELHDILELWDVLFFGERRVLAVDFRTDITAPQSMLPIIHTNRGWLPNRRWTYAA